MNFSVPPAKVLIVVVLFKRGLDNLPALRSLQEQLPVVGRTFHLLYDNSPTSLDRGLSSGWSYFHDPQNGGLSRAYNYAFGEAKKLQCEWILVLDQDSTVAPDFVVRLSKAIDSLKDNDVVAVVPIVSMDGRQLSPLMPHIVKPRPVKVRDSIVEGWLLAVNSGAAIRVDFIDSIGGFSKEFWLDFLDHWLFRTIYKSGKRILVTAASVEHHLSVADLNHGVTPDRYRNMLAAERYFTNKYLGELWRLSLPPRLLARSMKHLAVTRDKTFSRLMLRAAANQMVAIFRSKAPSLPESASSVGCLRDKHLVSMSAKRPGPRISVCIATYNGEKYLRRQLETILAQLSEADEVIVSDDSSTDRTLQIVETFNDPRIRVFEGLTFRSPVYNFEHALKNAKGEIIVLSDQDDEWVLGRIESALYALQRVSLVVCDAEVIDSEGKVVRRSLHEISNARPGLLLNLVKNSYAGCCMAFRREVLEVALPFPRNLPWHDWWIGLVAEYFFSSSFLRQRLIRYRRHSSNASTTGGPSTLTWGVRLAHRWRMICALAMRAMQQRHRRSATQL